MKEVPFFWITRDRDSLYRIINSRVVEMVRKGWIDEVRKLLKQDSGADYPCFHSLGYREAADFVGGRITREEMTDRIQQQTRKYAKRQITYFKNQFFEAEIWDYMDLLKALEMCDWSWSRLTENK